MKTARTFITLSLLFSSCGPHYNPPHPKPPVGEHWKAKQPEEEAPPQCPQESIAVEEVLFRPWWQIFQDPLLDDFEARAIADSPTIASAIARLAEAKANWGVAYSNLYPELDLLLSASRSKIPQNVPLAGQNLGLNPTSTSPLTSSQLTPKGVGGVLAPSPCVTLCPPPPPPPVIPKAPRPPRHISELAVLPELSYEVDLWEKYSQETKSAFKRVEAQEEDLESALLLLTSQVAINYLQLRTYDFELDVLEQNRLTRQHAYDLQEEKYTKGLITELDFLRAKVELTGVEQDIEATRILRRASENSLAALIGTSASEFVVKKKDVIAPLPQIPASIPSSILETRPDIRMQDRLLEAYALDVGVAKTAYFPTITLFLEGGYIADKFSKLFKWKSHVWSASAQAMQVIFDAGRISSQVDAAIARYQQSVASYVDTVLTAFKEVEDALTSVSLRKKQLDFLDQEVTAAREVFRLTTLQYDTGLTDYLNVVNAEQSMLTSERQQVIVTRDQYSAIITLIKSLGGVWNNEENNN